MLGDAVAVVHGECVEECFNPLIWPARFDLFFLFAVATRYKTFMAACSVGKCPLCLTAQRNRAVKDSIEVVVYGDSHTAPRRLNPGFWSSYDIL